MIATLEGVLEHRGSDSLVLNVGGIGFEVHVPSSTLSAVADVGQKVALYTYLQAREDNVALFGFASREELALFKMVLSVSGVGPRVALAVVSALNPEQVAAAISGGDVDTISQVPGIGRKMATRLVVELRDKLDKESRSSGIVPPSESSDLIGALMSLGYSAREASRAAARVPGSAGTSLEARVKAALQQLVAE